MRVLSRRARRSGAPKGFHDPRAYSTHARDNFTLLGTPARKAAEAQLEEIRALADDVPVPAKRHRSRLVTANWRFRQAVHLASGSRWVITRIRQAVSVVPTNFVDVFPNQSQHGASDHDALATTMHW